MTDQEYRVLQQECTMLKMPEQSEWICYLFGSKGNYGLQYRPLKGKEPNAFIRWMMKICFACTWERTK